MTTATSDPIPGHEGQTFLVGEEIYLRGIEKIDAARAMSWRQGLYPRSPEATGKWIEEKLPNQENQLLLAIVRKADDLVVGSVTLYSGDIHPWLDARVDPLYGDRGQSWKGEAMTIVADWIVNERGQVGVTLSLAANEEIVITAIEAFGMRQTARFREMYERDGRRVDRLVYEYLSPVWMANLGDPNEASLERTGTGEPRPVPPPVDLDGDPPANAVMIGKRVYLRPEEPDDAENIVASMRQETESFFEIGRHLDSSVGLRKWIENGQKPDWPTWIGFAVCLRETGERIGWVGLIGVNYEQRTAETGSRFDEIDYRGGGYGSEAKQLLLEYAFDRIGLHMVESWVLFPNTRSAAALRKQGYREAGRINWLYPFEGGLGNFVAFDLLAEEWRVMPRQEWKA